jgi:oxalate decarboxylase
MRTPHWNTAGNELLYVQDGVAFISMMDDDGKVYQRLVQRGDLISIPVGNFFGLINVGSKDLEIYEAIQTPDKFNEITLLGGAKQFNTDVIQGALNISKDSANKLLQNKDVPPITTFKY